MKSKKVLYFKLACIGGHNLKAFVRSFNNCGPGLFVFILLLLLTGCNCKNPTEVILPNGSYKWVPVQFRPDSMSYYCTRVDFIDPLTGWADNMKTNTGGKSWQQCNMPVVGFGWKYDFIDCNHGWLSTDTLIYFTNDGGNSWTASGTGINSNLYISDIFFIDSLYGWAVGRANWFENPDNVIVATQDGGKSWEIQYQTLEGPLYGVHFVNRNIGWAAGCYYYYPGITGWILHTTDGGTTWNTQFIGYRTLLRDIIFINEQQGWAAGWLGRILYTSDGGNSWNVTQLDSSYYFEVINFIDQNNGWVGGTYYSLEGVIFSTRNGGRTWTRDVIDAPEKPRFMYQVQFMGRKFGWASTGEYLLKYVYVVD